MRLSHGIKASTDNKNVPIAPDVDPSVGIISKVFERESQAAHRYLEGGLVKYGKHLLTRVTSYCIACHTRSDRGPNFPQLSLNIKAEGLPPMERANLWAATRQFDRALESYRQVISNREHTRLNLAEWKLAFSSALTIAIRVKQDADLALTLVNEALAATGDSHELQALLKTSKQGIVSWKTENPLSDSSEESLFAELSRLQTKAETAVTAKEFYLAEVTYLRATRVAHELLSEYPNGKRVGEALMVLGEAYTKIGTGIVFLAPETYFEACIRKAPHTPVANICLQKFKQATSGRENADYIFGDLKEFTSELAALAAM